MYSAVYGLPCSHTIRKMIIDHGVISLDSISKQWLLDIPSFRNQDQFHNLIDYSSKEYLNPKEIKTKGRPKNARNKKRDPSLFEHVLAEFSTSSKLRRCGRCKKEGHNSRTCIEKSLE